MTLRADPPVRADGRCAVCRGPRQVPKKHHREIAREAYELDPFCSNTCARAYHGNPIPASSVWSLSPDEKRGKHARAA